MRLSNLFGQTLRDAPAEAEVDSHKLLVRAAFIRQLGAGLFSYLLLAKRSITKIENIMRDEINAIVRSAADDQGRGHHPHRRPDRAAPRRGARTRDSARSCPGRSHQTSRTLGRGAGAGRGELLLGVLGTEEDAVGDDGVDRSLRALYLELRANLAELRRDHREADVLLEARRPAS